MVSQAGCTAAHLAARWDQAPSLRVLVEEGKADITLVNKVGCSVWSRLLMSQVERLRLHRLSYQILNNLLNPVVSCVVWQDAAGGGREQSKKANKKQVCAVLEIDCCHRERLYPQAGESSLRYLECLYLPGDSSSMVYGVHAGRSQRISSLLERPFLFHVSALLLCASLFVCLSRHKVPSCPPSLAHQVQLTRSTKKPFIRSPQCPSRGR